MAKKQDIESQYKQALKEKDKLRVSVIRMMKSSIQNEEIKQQKELEDSQIIKLLATLQKQTQESIKQFAEGGRQDLVDKESLELEIIKSFLPRELSSEELALEINGAISEVEAQSIQDLGKVMKAVMPRITGRADGKVVSALVKQKLQEL